MAHANTHPPDDPRMWKRLLSRAHPDTGGGHELFIWTRAVKDVVCGGELKVEPKPRPAARPDDRLRVPWCDSDDFEEVTRTALMMGALQQCALVSIHWFVPRILWMGRAVRDYWHFPSSLLQSKGSTFTSTAVGEPYGRVLSLLADCKPLEDLAHEQRRGASYKRLAAIAHVWGMTKAERIGWYRVAEDLPLSDRHAGHILSRLKRRAA